jgi:hypothetical protein
VRHKQIKTIAGLLVVATIGAALGAFAASGPGLMSTLTSTGAVTAGTVGTLANLANGVAPKNQIAVGDTATWIDKFQNTAARIGGGSLVQSWDPARQTVQPDSVKVPAGWNASYSTDGASWLSSPPSDVTTIRAVQASAEFTPEAGKAGVVTRIAPPVASSVSTSISGGGDSYFPVFRNNKVFSVPHHGNLVMVCFNKLTGATCGSVTPSRSLTTAGHSDGWVNPRTGRAYVPAVDSTGIVLACLDLDLLADCGITPIGNGSTSKPAFVSEPWSFANQVMFLFRDEPSSTLKVGCFSLTTSAACAGQPFSTGIPGMVDGAKSDYRSLNIFWSSDGQNPYRTDGKVAYTFTPSGTSLSSLACFDSATRTACSGVATASWDSGQDPTPRLDANGVLVGFCSRPSMTAAVTCFDLAGAPLAVSPAFEAWLPIGELAWNTSWGGVATTAGTRTFIPWSVNQTGRVVCFDWSTDAPCPNFPIVTPVATKPYTLRHDPFAPACVWSMGDDGILESFETHSGLVGCNMTTVAVAPTYCDGRTDHVTGWDRLKLNDIAGGYTGFALTLRDSDGKVVPGWLLKNYPAATSSIDISSVPFSGAKTALTIELFFVGLSPTAFVTATPTIEVTWKGDPVEMCVTTIVRDFCPAVYVPLQPMGVKHRTDATVTTGTVVDKVAVELAFDAIMPPTCATAGVAVSTSVNGQRPVATPGLRIRQGDPVALSYSVRNLGQTLLGGIEVVDNASTADPTDDIKPVYASGDLNANGFVEPTETWIYTAIGHDSAGAHVTGATVAASAFDATGLAIPGGVAVSNSDVTYYFIAMPAVALSAVIYVGHDGGLSCSSGSAILNADQDAPVTYCYVITNTGNEPLTSIRLADLGIGATQQTMTLASGSLVTLLPGESTKLWVERVNTAYLASNATATATPQTGSDVTATAATERVIGPKSYPAT